MRKGYRDCDSDFNIKSDVEQFNFSKAHVHLRLNIDWTLKEKMAPVERTDFYLIDGRVIKNIFIVDGQLAYYYEMEEYYSLEADPRAPVLIPDKNVLERFDFAISDIALVHANNIPEKPMFDLGYIVRIDWLFFSKPNPLDTRKAINENIFVKIEQWDKLPEKSSDDLYSKAS